MGTHFSQSLATRGGTPTNIVVVVSIEWTQRCWCDGHADRDARTRSRLKPQKLARSCDWPTSCYRVQRFGPVDYLFRGAVMSPVEVRRLVQRVCGEFTE